MADDTSYHIEALPASVETLQNSVALWRSPPNPDTQAHTGVDAWGPGDPLIIVHGRPPTYDPDGKMYWDFPGSTFVSEETALATMAQISGVAVSVNE